MGTRVKRCQQSSSPPAAGFHTDWRHQRTCMHLRIQTGPRGQGCVQRNIVQGQVPTSTRQALMHCATRSIAYDSHGLYTMVRPTGPQQMPATRQGQCACGASSSYAAAAARAVGFASTEGAIGPRLACAVRSWVALPGTNAVPERTTRQGQCVRWTVQSGESQRPPRCTTPDRCVATRIQPAGSPIDMGSVP